MFDEFMPFKKGDFWNVDTINAMFQYLKGILDGGLRGDNFKEIAPEHVFCATSSTTVVSPGLITENGGMMRRYDGGMSGYSGGNIDVEPGVRIDGADASRVKKSVDRVNRLSRATMTILKDFTAHIALTEWKLIPFWQAKQIEMVDSRTLGLEDATIVSAVATANFLRGCYGQDTLNPMPGTPRRLLFAPRYWADQIKE